MPRLDLAHLALDSFAGQPVAVLGAGAQRHRPDALPRRPRRAMSPSTTRCQPRRSTRPWPRSAMRRPRLLLGPDIDPRRGARGQALICTSPSVSSRFPTTEPRLRAALAAVEAEGRVPVVSEVDLFLRLMPGEHASASPARRARRRRARSSPPSSAAGPRAGAARRQHRTPAHRARHRARRQPPRRARALGAPAADALAGHRRGRLHACHVRPPRPPWRRRGLSRGQAAARRAAAAGRRARPQRGRSRSSARTRRAAGSADRALPRAAPTTRRRRRRGWLDRRSRPAAGHAPGPRTVQRPP